MQQKIWVMWSALVNYVHRMEKRISSSVADFEDLFSKSECKTSFMSLPCSFLHVTAARGLELSRLGMIFPKRKKILSFSFVKDDLNVFLEL